MLLSSYQEWCDVFIRFCCTFCCKSYLWFTSFQTAEAWFKTSKYPSKQVVFIWEICIWAQQVLASKLFVILLLSYLTKLRCWRLYGVSGFRYHLWIVTRLHIRWWPSEDPSEDTDPQTCDLVTDQQKRVTSRRLHNPQVCYQITQSTGSAGLLPDYTISGDCVFW